MEDEYDLQRFVRAQAPVYGDAIDILRHGGMCTPYMDFIFPRLAGDGGGAARGYAIASLDEASAYLTVAVLGGRYRECAHALLWFPGKSAENLFGEVNARKLHSSLTLFAEASNYEPLFSIMLDIWFDWRLDEETIARLGMA